MNDKNKTKQSKGCLIFCKGDEHWLKHYVEDILIDSLPKNTTTTTTTTTTTINVVVVVVVVVAVVALMWIFALMWISEALMWISDALMWISEALIWISEALNDVLGYLKARNNLIGISTIDIDLVFVSFGGTRMGSTLVTSQFKSFWRIAIENPSPMVNPTIVRTYLTTKVHRDHQELKQKSFSMDCRRV